MVDVTNSGQTPPNFRFPSIWTVGALCVAALVLIPVVAIFWLALFPSENIWPHLISTSLPRYASNSIILMASVGLASAVIGTVCAWLVVMYEFPLRRMLEWALLLPLALPAYIGAYALVDFWEYAGPFQTYLRGWFGWSSAADYRFPEPRSLYAAAIVLTMSLYPYVYFLTRAAFKEQSGSALEVSRSLGKGPLQTFLKVGLPLARPAIFASVAIVMMETLNDFGTVEFFAIQTLTTGIFTVWLEASNVGGAAQIACVILAFVLCLVTLEKISRRRIRFHETAKQRRAVERAMLPASKAVLALLVCGMPILLGFAMPSSIMLYHAIGSNEWAQTDLWDAMRTTLVTSGSAAVLTVAAAIFLVYGARLSLSKLPRLLVPATTIGYAAPGAVLAIGILIPFAAFDNSFADLLVMATGIEPGLLITGTAGAVIMAYCIRFFAIAFGSIDSAFGRVTPNMGWASRSLGQNKLATLLRVYLPMIKGSALTAGLLIFVDATKELPATLLLRPFGMNTLATRVYDSASLEDINGAAPAALMIVLIGLASVAIVTRLLQTNT